MARLRIETTPRSRRIWAPRPISRHCVARLASEPDLGLAEGRHRHAGGAVPQVDEDAPPLPGDALHRRLQGAALEEVGDDVLPVQAHRQAGAVADAAEDEGDVLHGIEGRRVGIAGERPPFRLDRKGGDALDELFAGLPMGDEIGDRDALQVVALGEGGDLVPLHHRAVVVRKLADDADRRQAGEAAQIDRRLGMARAHQDAAVLGDEREDVARADEIGGAHVVVGERPHRVAALLGRDAGRQPVADVDGDREGGAEGRVVRGDHRIEAQAPRLGGRQGRADDAAGVADDEGHLLRRAEGRGDDEVALVLAVVVVRDDDDLAAGEGLEGIGDRVRHGSPQGSEREEIVGRHRAAGFPRDLRGGIAGHPGMVVVAKLGDRPRRHADPPRELDAGELSTEEPVGELHGRDSTAA